MLSLRDVEDLLAERGVAVSCETVRRWLNHFGPVIAADLRKRRLKPHTTWRLDEVYSRKLTAEWPTFAGPSTPKAILDVLVRSSETSTAPSN